MKLEGGYQSDALSVLHLSAEVLGNLVSSPRKNLHGRNASMEWLVRHMLHVSSLHPPLVHHLAENRQHSVLIMCCSATC